MTFGKQTYNFDRERENNREKQKKESNEKKIQFHHKTELFPMKK